MLGWKILKTGEYETELRRLSDEEEALVLSVAECFKDKARTKRIASDLEARETIADLISDCAHDEEIYLSDSQKDYLAETAYYHTYGFAFLSRLLEDDTIEEISVIGINKPAYVFIRNQGWKAVDACFTEESAIMEMINKMAASIGRRITLQNPRLNAVLPDGSRLHASLPPVSQGEITIRKFRGSPFPPHELCSNSTLSVDAMAMLSLAMQGDFSLIVSGNTASGKTTTLNALFSFVPANERVLLVEETPEINIPHSHCLRLVSNPEMGILLKDLVRDSLRMRPDRIVVGEVRSPDEAEALFDVLLGGQARGSYATFHAQSARETLNRLRSLGVNEADLPSIDLILVQRRMLQYDPRKRKNFELRRLVEIAEVDGNNTIPVFSRKNSTLVFNPRCSFPERICSDLNISKAEFQQELKIRSKLLSSMKSEFLGSFSKIQKVLYGIQVSEVKEDD